MIVIIITITIIIIIIIIIPCLPDCERKKVSVGSNLRRWKETVLKNSKIQKKRRQNHIRHTKEYQHKHTNILEFLKLNYI